VLEYLLEQRLSDADPHELDGALWAAVWNSNPYKEQRPAADFEKCVGMLLEAGAPVVQKRGNRGELMAAAVFSRNPGGNVRVMQMLATAGANPNPENEKGKKLSEWLAEACSTPNCSVPSESVLETYEKLANVKIERRAAK
jgi:hypothetical protein